MFDKILEIFFKFKKINFNIKKIIYYDIPNRIRESFFTLYKYKLFLIM